jgi:hypothetical protein
MGLITLMKGQPRSQQGQPGRQRTLFDTVTPKTPAHFAEMVGG